MAVAVPLPVQTAFSYRVPEALPLPQRGCRVLVPFGGRRVIGIATGPGAETEAGLKDVLDVIDEAPLLPPPLLDLAAWVADHYLAPPGECFRLLLPPAGIRASRAVVRLVGEPLADAGGVAQLLSHGPLTMSTLAHRLKADPSAQVARLRRAGLAVIEQNLDAPGFRQRQVASLVQAGARPEGRAQSAVVERLSAAGGRAVVGELVRDRPSLRGALQRLAAAGVVRVEAETALRQPAVAEGSARPQPDLTRDQAEALQPILDGLGAGYAAFLLRGVTGSGKTEVYFRAAERAIGLGKGVLILVPEIALTPLLVRAAAARFGPEVSVLHSQLSTGERHDQWWRIREGDSRVVIGARSAVFAPLPDLGLLVVDEEHEAAYKQEESPRYHGRDVAVMRAKLEGAVAVLGSATPSVESQANLDSGKYRGLLLPARIATRGLPAVELVDRRKVIKAGGDPILTPPLREALAARLARGEQSLLLLNRRGYATSLVCRECGVQATCPDCSVSLTLHAGGRQALCHYCGYQRAAPTSCGACRGEYLKLTGYGTERVVDAVVAAFPRARVDRLDRDRVSRRGTLARVLAAFESGALDVLVGTQMIAKGHDFPRVTLVGVIDADVGLGLPDFRSAERTFQLLTQVAGRAGRAELAGEVILQTHLPDHYAVELACAQDYADFYAREIEFRRSMGYPPTASLLNLVLRSRDAAQAAESADALGRRLRESGNGRYRVLGPARAPLARLKQEHRFQILLKGQRRAMREAVRAALVERYGEVRWPGVIVDVDPLSVM